MRNSSGIDACLISLTIPQDRITDSRQFVRERTGGFIVIPACLKIYGPRLERIKRLARLIAIVAACNTARAPCVSNILKYTSPRREIPPNDRFVPEEYSRGVNPNHDAKWRAL